MKDSLRDQNAKRDTAFALAQARARKSATRFRREYAILDRWAARGRYNVLRTTDLNAEQRSVVVAFIRPADPTSVSPTLER